MQVVIVENPLDKSSWTTHEVPDLLAFLKEKWPTFPEHARIYHGLVCKSNDVTPGSEADVERLKTLAGPFFVVVYPGFTALLIVAAVIFAVAAVALTPSIPTLPTPVVARNQQAASPNNELSDRTNRARINGRIPDIFGKVRSTPDLIAAPYKIFEAGREVEYAYMCIGRGFYDVADVRDGETLCENIPGVLVNVYAPFTSPNSGDDPQLTIGGLISAKVLNTRRSNSVNGQVLRPPNNAEIVGNRNIYFQYPNMVRYASTEGVTPFSSEFAEGDSLTITGAEYDSAGGTTEAPRGEIGLMGTQGPMLTTGLPSSYFNGGFISWQLGYGATGAPPGVEVGNTIEIVQAQNDLVTDYQAIGWDGVTLDSFGFPAHQTVTGANANLSGVYDIAEVYIVGSPSGASIMYVLLDDPAAVNAAWDEWNGRVITVGPGGSIPDALTVTVNASIPDLDLDGVYTIVAVSGDIIVLDNPVAVAADWALLDSIAGDKSPVMSPTLSVTGPRWVGPFILSQGQDDTNSIFCNFVATNGLYKDDGTDQIAASVDVLVEVVPVDENDEPIGSPQTAVATLTGSATLKETVARTLEMPFLGFTGRCQIRARRVTEADSLFTGQVVDEVRWRDVYSVAPVAQTDFGNVTTVHSKTYATASALAVKERKLTMEVTRKLPARIDETSAFTDDVPVATLDAAPILVSICRDRYIGNRPLSEIDVANIYDTVAAIQTYFGSALATQFCYTFDNDNLSFEETVALVAQALHCVAYRRGSLIKLSFEKKTDDSTLLFNHRNKVPRSEVREFAFGYANENDGIEYTYVDPEDDSIITIFLPEGYPATNPKKIESVGVRNHLQAYFLAWRAWNKIRYQTIGVRFEATQEADLLLRNDRILVTDSTRQIAQDGEVIGVNVLELTLSQNVDMSLSASHVVHLQLYDGSVEVIDCVAGSDPNKIELADAPSLPLVTDVEGYTKTGFVIVGSEESQQLAFLVTEKEPLDKMTSTVSAINYDSRYYDNDTDLINEVIDEDAYGGSGGFTPATEDPPYTPGDDPPDPGFTREVFLTADTWLVPTGVTEIDILLVGAGANSGGTPVLGGIAGMNGGGGGGGSVMVVHGVPVTPGESLDIDVAPGTTGGSWGDAGIGSIVKRTIGGEILAQSGDSGGGGGDGVDGQADGFDGTANAALVAGGTIATGSVGGSGGGGSWGDTVGTGGSGAGTAGNGGNPTNIGGGDPNDQSSGGGGGAGGNGTNGTSSTNPGDGGNGIVPPNHTYGAWGTDIGEGGVFGGGGGGANCIDAFGSPTSDTFGTPGQGNGAANTGGGATPNAAGTFVAGYSGLIAIVYATPP